MRLTAASSSEVGQVRSLNEDAAMTSAELVAVADGMGGHRSGEVASAKALEVFELSARQAVSDDDGSTSLEAWMEAVRAANRAVFEDSKTSPDLSGMGTTLCAVGIVDLQSVAVVNVGDSRVYLLRNGVLQQISLDHSFVETLVRDGRLTREQADVHPQRNVLSRAIGIEHQIDVDGWQVPVRNGDRFLLCSDGLFNELGDDRLREVLSEVADPVEAASQLTAEANEHGGRDNITCVVADVSDVADAELADIDFALPVHTTVIRRSAAADFDETIMDSPTVPRSPVDSEPLLQVSGRPPRRFGWRTAVFLTALVGIFVAALAATDWYYKNTYAVGVSKGSVVLYQGPPDTDVLWFSAKQEATGIDLDALSQADRAEVTNGLSGLSRDEADSAIKNLRDRAATSTTTTTTTTTTTSTTVPPTIAPATEVPATVVAPSPAGP